MADTYLTDEVMAIVGTTTPARRGLITERDIRKFCAAIDETNPLYLDADVAHAAGYAGVISPPLFHESATRPVPHRTGLLDDGQYDTVAPPSLSHLQLMLVGQSWEVFRPAVAGERVVAVMTAKSVTERPGRTGNIVLVEQESTITTSAGELIERYVDTQLLRKPPPRPPFDPSPPRAVEASGPPTTYLSPDRMIKRPDMIALFMFSAAIWGVHRIHWDTPYALSEGFPLPVLPGWMLSSYLAQLAELRAPKGQRLRRIAVRYRGLAHPGDTLTCTAADQAGPMDVALSITNQAGAEVVVGEAAYAPL